MNLVKAELFKIRTTALWWIFAIVLVPLWTASILANWASATMMSSADPSTAGEHADQFRAAAEAVNIATTLYTSGQFFGILLVLVLSAIVVTNEFFHQTATATFLVTPRREQVIGAKFAAAAVVGVAVWAITTVGNLIVAPLILSRLHLDAQLGTGAVWRAIALNALAFVLWSILGVGFGVLIRNQLAATLVLTIAYLIGTSAVGVIFTLLAARFGEWIAKLQVLVPTTASQLMIAGTELPGSPPRWVGAVVLIGYTVLTGAVGTLLTRRRDIT